MLLDCPAPTWRCFDEKEGLRPADQEKPTSVDEKPTDGESVDDDSLDEDLDEDDFDEDFDDDFEEDDEFDFEDEDDDDDDDFDDD